jgi:hypothetical protein
MFNLTVFSKNDSAYFNKTVFRLGLDKENYYDLECHHGYGWILLVVVNGNEECITSKKNCHTIKECLDLNVINEILESETSQMIEHVVKQYLINKATKLLDMLTFNKNTPIYDSIHGLVDLVADFDIGDDDDYYKRY